MKKLFVGAVCIAATFSARFSLGCNDSSPDSPEGDYLLLLALLGPDGTADDDDDDG